MLEQVLQKLSWLGHDCFKYSGPPVIYFDPYELSNGEPADLILISHDHFDHCSPSDVAKIQLPNTVIVTMESAAAQLSGSVIILRPGERTQASGLTIEAVPAYNLNKDFHPQKAGHLGFIVTIDGVRLYHAGDTDFIPEMKGLKVDIALLPVSGTYVMTAAEAAQAARAIEPQIAIPMHYGSIVGSGSDAKTFKSLLEGRIRVEILPRA
ncbi:MAG: MBL fold metallo-hydrolase [Deltaproteobacteria bacterium]|nr:MBL fold metallo-hydrolase [Deltaproteobacteria bacterium]MBW1953338.1 MBL fold metallo-hydrolase [Deltaproteobacteria bacterium]MBW1986869.1 MBL fold metallo-hydrolase [Deltaproteobacteria bacterium]